MNRARVRLDPRRHARRRSTQHADDVAAFRNAQGSGSSARHRWSATRSDRRTAGFLNFAMNSRRTASRDPTPEIGKRRAHAQRRRSLRVRRERVHVHVDNRFALTLSGRSRRGQCRADHQNGRDEGDARPHSGGTIAHCRARITVDCRDIRCRLRATSSRRYPQGRGQRRRPVPGYGKHHTPVPVRV